MENLSRSALLKNKEYSCDIFLARVLSLFVMGCKVVLRACRTRKIGFMFFFFFFLNRYAFFVCYLFRQVVCAMGNSLTTLFTRSNVDNLKIIRNASLCSPPLLAYFFFALFGFVCLFFVIVVVFWFCFRLIFTAASWSHKTTFLAHLMEITEIWNARILLNAKFLPLSSLPPIIVSPPEISQSNPPYE